MSIQPVSTPQRASEAPASRRRAEGGAGEAFALPGQQEGAAAGAEKGSEAKTADKAAAIEEAVAAKTGGGGEKIAVAAKGDATAVKTADVAVKSVAPGQEGAQAEAASQGAGIDFLIAMAAAQMEAAAARGEETSQADGKAKPAEGDQKAAEAESEEASAADSQIAPAGQIAIAVPETHPVAVPALPLPVASAESEQVAAQPGSGSTSAMGDAAKQQAAVPVAIALAASGSNPTKSADPIGAGDAVETVDGKGGTDAGHAAESKGAEERPVVGAGPKIDAVAAAAAPAASDPKPFDSLQQALGPLDLSAMLQHASARPGHDRMVQPLDPNPMPNGGAAVPGQGAAGGQPTPIHVVPIEIGLRAMSGSRQFDIRLDPDELGRVDVNLSISDNGEVSARLVVDRVETLHLLQRDARTLERAFEQAGLKPSDGGVDISLRDPSDQSAFRQNRQQDEAPQRPRPPRDESAENAPLSIDPAPQRRLVRLGGVDLSI